MPIEQCVAISWQQLTFDEMMMMSAYAKLEFYSVNQLKQRCADGDAAPLGHIILTLYMDSTSICSRLLILYV